MMNSFVTRGGWWVVAQSILMLAVLATGVAFRASEREVSKSVPLLQHASSERERERGEMS